MRPGAAFGVVLAVLGWVGPMLAAEPAAGGASLSVIRDCADCPAMVVLPAGRFVMGSPALERAQAGISEERGAREAPQHVVRFARRFAIGRTAVTRGMFADFVAATARPVAEGCDALDPARGVWRREPALSWEHPGFVQTSDDPVVCVTLADATDYAAWMSRRTGHRYRLPSDAEWEYAARGGTTTARFWGEGFADACRHANVGDLARLASDKDAQEHPEAVVACNDGFARTSPVGMFPANRFGLFDMQGDVWNWTADCDHPTYVGAPSDGSVWQGGDCRRHSDRGGSWDNSPKYVRSAVRHVDLVGERDQALGFRLVRAVD